MGQSLESGSTPLVIQVFTHREGLARRFGHDLRLTTRSARWALRTDRVEVRVPLRTLEVDGAMRGGKLDSSALSSGDRDSILRAMRQEVLQCDRHPEASFDATAHLLDGDRVELRGELTLKERRVPLVVQLEKQGLRLVGTVALQPSRWGIRPYSAMAGALKVSDAVDVRIELALDAGSPWPPDTLR